MPGDRESVRVRLFDEDGEVLRADPLRLEAGDAPRRPVVHLAADGVGGHGVVVPPPPPRSEVGTGVEEPRSGPLPALDGEAQLAHAVGVQLPGREGRGHAVGEEKLGIGGRLIHAALAEEVDGVMRVQVDEPRQDRLLLPKVEPRAKRARVRGRADGNDAPVLDPDALVRHECAGVHVQPAPPRDQIGSVEVPKGARDLSAPGDRHRRHDRQDRPTPPSTPPPNHLPPPWFSIPPPSDVASPRETALQVVEM